MAAIMVVPGTPEAAGEAGDDAQAVAPMRVPGASDPIASWCGAGCLGRFAPEDEPERA